MPKPCLRPFLYWPLYTPIVGWGERGGGREGGEEGGGEEEEGRRGGRRRRGGGGRVVNSTSLHTH